jgi:LysM repeat protein
MKNALTLGIIFCVNFLFFAQDPREINYILNYAKLAVTEMQLYKIPASITLSQGMLETGGGQSRLAEKANNHFGIKCKAEWTGEKIYHDDDALGECFRKYPSVDDSFRDHSKFLAERPYYKNLFNLALVDYKAWANGLKKAGYATNPNYAGILINKIEKYNLAHFDTLTPEKVDQKLMELYPNNSSNIIPKPIPVEVIDSKESILINEKTKVISEQIESQLHQNHRFARIKNHENGVNYIIVEKGETIDSIAKLYVIDRKKLLFYNDLINPILIEEGQLLFFDKKKTKGMVPDYVVQKGDTMYLISQKMGISIHCLYKMNGMKYGEEPQLNRVLDLQ